MTPQVERSLLPQVAGHTVLLAGAAGTGKSTLAMDLAGALASEGERAAIVTADMGQPLIGVPTCLAAAFEPPWKDAGALWFIGDTMPVRHLLPVVVGTAQLAAAARARGAETVLVDTSGLVAGSIGRVLKYHKALATGTSRALVFEHRDELEELASLLELIGPVHRLRPSPRARDRSAEERRTFRRDLYREHFRGVRSRLLPLEKVVSSDWSRGPPRKDLLSGGRVAGLCDERGFCLALGLIDSIEDQSVRVHTTWRSPGAVASVRLGALRIDRRAGFAESR